MDTWEPITASALRVGHFVRIGHGWLDHPFLRRTFRIETAQELALLRDAGLTRLSIDPARSTVVSTAARGASWDATADSKFDVGQESARLQAEKAAHANAVRQRRAELLRTQLAYETSASSAERLFAELRGASPSAGATAEALVCETLRRLEDGGGPLSSASTHVPHTRDRRLGCLALDAMSLALAVGCRSGIRGDELELLGTGALLHGVGLRRLPDELREEHSFASYEAQLEFQDYPLLGCEMLRECGGFSAEVLQIVRQHRERADGSGYPEGATSTTIHRLAPIVGAVREFQVLSANRAVGMPAAALAHLYRNLREAYGHGVIDNLIAAVTIYPPGSFLSLSDGSIARVMRVSAESRLRPTVSLFDAAVRPDKAEILDLTETGDLNVAKVLNPAHVDGAVRHFFGDGWSGYALGVSGPR